MACCKCWCSICKMIQNIIWTLFGLMFYQEPKCHEKPPVIKNIIAPSCFHVTRPTSTSCSNSSGSRSSLPWPDQLVHCSRQQTQQQPAGPLTLWLLWWVSSLIVQGGVLLLLYNPSPSIGSSLASVCFAS